MNQPAGLKPRLLAFLFDYLVILGYIAVLVILSTSFAGFRQIFQRLFQHPVQSDVVAFLILVLPVILYFAIQEGGVHQATWGKRRMKLEVTGTGERNLGISRALVRSVVKFLPWQIGHTAIFHSLDNGVLPQSIVWILFVLAYGLALLYLVLIWKSPLHRTVYDWISGTVVQKNE